MEIRLRDFREGFNGRLRARVTGFGVTCVRVFWLEGPLEGHEAAIDNATFREMRRSNIPQVEEER